MKATIPTTKTLRYVRAFNSFKVRLKQMGKRPQHEREFKIEIEVYVALQRVAYDIIARRETAEKIV
jgi:hypothetical protein